MTRRVALLALHGAVALFGCAALFGKWVALPATIIVLGRSVTAAAMLVVVARLRRQPLGAAGSDMLANGAILALHWVTFFAAVQAASVAIALLGYAVFPVVVPLLERRDVPKDAAQRRLGTALLAACGLIALVPHLSWTGTATRGLALGLASGVTFAWLTVRNRRLVANRSAIAVAMWQNALAAACLLPVALVMHRHLARPDAADIALLVVLGTLCTGLAHTLFIASMRSVTAHSASVVAALEPVYGIALAALLVGEIPDGRTIIGGLLIMSAAVIASRGGFAASPPVSVASTRRDE